MRNVAKQNLPGIGNRGKIEERREVVSVAQSSQSLLEVSPWKIHTEVNCQFKVGDS